MKEVGTMGKRMGKESILTSKRYFYSVGSVYEGNWQNDQQNGFGRMYYENQDSYEGECKFWLDQGCMGRKVEKESTFTTQEMFMKGNIL